MTLRSRTPCARCQGLAEVYQGLEYAQNRLLPALSKGEGPRVSTAVSLRTSSRHRSLACKTSLRGALSCDHDLPARALSLSIMSVCPAEARLPQSSYEAPLFVPARFWYTAVPQIDTEEVTVPLVLSRLFHQIIPSLPPVLVERGGAPVSATVFR